MAMMNKKRQPRFTTIIHPGFSGPSSDNPDVAVRSNKRRGQGATLDPQAVPDKTRKPNHTDDPFLPAKSNLTVRRARYAMARLSGLDKTSAAKLTDSDDNLSQAAFAARGEQLERATAEDMRALREQLGMICRELLADGLDLKEISGAGLSTMLEVALNRNAPFKDRLGAAKELATIGGLYHAPKDEAEAPQESEAIRNEIATKLKSLFGDARFAPTAPEITAHPVPPSPGKMPWD